MPRLRPLAGVLALLLALLALVTILATRRAESPRSTATPADERPRIVPAPAPPGPLPPHEPPPLP